MNRRIESEAKTLLKEHHVDGVPVDIESIARALGVQVNFEALENDISGLILFENGSARVAINNSQHPNRQRFTLAHEIGHLRLHTTEEDRVFVDKRFFRNDASSKGELKEEIEANAFAASVLMPEKFISEYVDRDQGITDIDVFRLATKFEVSEQAMTLRLVKLGFIEPD